MERGREKKKRIDREGTRESTLGEAEAGSCVDLRPFLFSKLRLIRDLSQNES